jgi:uncharacterized YkwD family protein/spore coat assembly protein SafA
MKNAIKKLLRLAIICVMLCAATATMALADYSYTVKSGDTLYKIASSNGVTLSQLLSANPSISNPSLIYVGQKITIPSTKAVTYTIQKGDTMWGIAKRFEISYSELLKANTNITNPSMIYVGQKITIPDTGSLAAYEQQVFYLVNKERAARGLTLLTYNTELARMARIKSQDMIDNHYFSHESPTYGSPFKMMESFGFKFSAAGENIAYGQMTAEEVMNTWMNSAGHRANILSEAYTVIGIGVAKTASGTLYWTQEFMKPY